MAARRVLHRWTVDQLADLRDQLQACAHRRHVLPVEVSSLGKVRMYGRSMFRMNYDYVSIDGRPTGARLSAALRDEQ